MTAMLKQNKQFQLRKGVQPRLYLVQAEVRLVRRGKIGKETIEDSQAGAPPPTPATIGAVYPSLLCSSIDGGFKHLDSWVGKIRWGRDRLPTPVFLGFPGGSSGKESACNVGDLGSIPRLGRFPWRRERLPLQYSGLENSMDCIVHEVACKELDMTERISLSLSL